eukprot:6540907-Ditylum_brightwellii.AAC.1
MPWRKHTSLQNKEDDISKGKGEKAFEEMYIKIQNWATRNLKGKRGLMLNGLEEYTAIAEE